MSMHNQSEASFERINKSTPQETSWSEKDEDQQAKSRKRCIIIVLLVLVLAAAITALILVLVFKGSDGNSVPNGYTPYTVQDEPTNGKYFYKALLRKTDNITIDVPLNDTNPEFTDLSYRVSMMNDRTFRIKVNPVALPTEDNGLTEEEDVRRWEVPDDLLGNTKEDYGMRLTWGDFKGASQGSNPGIQTKFLSTKNRNLVFSEYYIEMGFLVNSKHIYGFGERQGEFELGEGEYSSWNDGRDNHLDTGKIGNNSYGDHPFVLAKLKDNTFAGIFFKNSNAKVLEVVRAGDQTILNFKAVGGVLDFFTFYADEAEDVLTAYHQVIGVPYFPPFWALGFHQGAWRYNTSDLVKEVIEAYDDNNMPLEGIWLDIEYMQDYKNFELNTDRFKSWSNTVGSLHQKGQKIVAIVDAGMAAQKGYKAYEDGLDKNVYIMSNTTGEPLIGHVWPGKSTFVDYFNPNATDYWVSWLKVLHGNVGNDGVWLDMNEITSFCQGECPGNDTQISQDEQFKYPYSPTGDEYDIRNFTISLDAKHYTAEGDLQEHNTEFNMHSLFGLAQAKATYQWWIDGTNVQGKRPFILSRSTFAGAGKYTSHWLGDNHSTWASMQQSIAGIMDFNMFGIPVVGADVCGFHNEFKQELCGRWMQLSAFYPFARNHYNLTDHEKKNLDPQEPYVLDEPYKSAARESIYQRYNFLRYMYTRLHEISTNQAATLIRPLLFAFPDDSGATKDPGHTFMVGKALKVTPVLKEDDSKSGTVDSYFPKGVRFISLNDMKTVIKGMGQKEELKASWNYTLVHQMEGTVIPHQDSKQISLPRTKNLIEDIGIDLVVFPNTLGKAKGSLYLDQNGDDTSDVANKFYQYYQVDYDNQTLSLSQTGGTLSKGTQDSGNQVLDNIHILGMNVTSTNMTGCVYDNDLVPRAVDVSYNGDNNIVTIRALETDSLLFNSIKSIQFSSDRDSSFCSPKYTISKITNVYRNGAENDTVKKVISIQSSSSEALPDLVATFELVQDTVLRVQINDPLDTTAFRAPNETLNLHPSSTKPTINIDAILTLPAEGEDFYYEVHDPLDPSIVLYTTKNQPFVYSKYYKRTTSVINSDGHIFGLGERVGDFFLDEGVYTMWARDIPSPVEDGKRPGNNVYGVHPVYFSKLSKGSNFFAVFDHNAGAQDYIIEKVDNDWTITHIKTSGVTDQFIFLSAAISEVVHEFINLVGNPTMVPEWGLGWHQCRYGYNNTNDVNTVVESYMNRDLPLDVMWTDIDYMDMYKDFTVSSTDFVGLKDNITNWRETYGIRYIPILDAAVAYDDGSDTSYTRGSSKGIFIKDPNNSKKPFIGKVWPGPAVYIDWLNDKAEKYWVDEMVKLHKKLPFDGMWIDMNEASNFCNGYCTRDQIVDDSIQDKLFYTPGARELNDKSISIDAIHSDGHTEFEAHSLYGFYMSKATSSFFNDTQKERPFVITRSTYTGVGKYVSHWLGDNFAQYDMLKYSVSGIMLFNMFGVPVTGADICGFIGDTNPKLCARWYALGAFYPFSRNHNDKNAIAQEPYVDMFNETMVDSSITYTDFFRMMSLRRYALHRYQYSYIHKSSTDGSVYFKPLFFDYPSDDTSYKRIEHNILLGDALKLSPVIDDSTITSYWFPDKDARWCPLWPVKKMNKCFTGNVDQKQQIFYDEVWMHIKSGSIVPTQLAEFEDIPKNINIDGLKNVTLDLAILTRDKDYKAEGFVRYDDGLTQDLTKYSEFYFNATGISSSIPLSTKYLDIDVQIIKDDSDTKGEANQKLGSIVVYYPSKYNLGKSSKLTVEPKDGDAFEVECKYDSTNLVARFYIKEGLQIDLRNIKHMQIRSK